MAEKRWEFELEHSTFSNKQSVRVDGRLLQAPAGTPGRHAFRIEGPTWEAVIDSLLCAIRQAANISDLIQKLT